MTFGSHVTPPIKAKQATKATARISFVFISLVSFHKFRPAAGPVRKTGPEQRRFLPEMDVSANSLSVAGVGNSDAQATKMLAEPVSGRFVGQQNQYRLRCMIR